MQPFSISLSQEDFNNPEKMKQFRQLMNKVSDEISIYTKQLSKELCITRSQASEICYLRTRSRHTN